MEQGLFPELGAKKKERTIEDLARDGTIQRLFQQGEILTQNTPMQVLNVEWNGPNRRIVTLKEVSTGTIDQKYISAADAMEYRIGTEFLTTVYSPKGNGWYLNLSDVMAELGYLPGIKKGLPLRELKGLDNEQEKYQN